MYVNFSIDLRLLLGHPVSDIREGVTKEFIEYLTHFQLNLINRQIIYQLFQKEKKKRKIA